MLYCFVQNCTKNSEAILLEFGILMRLNIHIIFDELADLAPELIGGGGIELDLVGVRVYRPGTRLDPAYLYLVDSKDSDVIESEGEAFSGASLEEPGSIVMIGSPAQAMKPCWKLIVLAAGQDFHSLFMRLQSIFERFNTWQEEILLATTGREDLQNIFDKAASVLQNPIALIGKSQTLVMKAGALPGNIDGSIWLELLNQGYARLENLSKKQLSELNQKLISTEEPFFLQKVSHYTDNCHMIAPLHNEGELFAMFGMSDLSAPITLGQVSLVRLLQDMMKRIILAETNKQHLGVDIDYYVDRIINGYLVEKEALSYSLAMRRWEIGDVYQAIFLKADNSAVVDDNMRNVLAVRVQSLILGAYAFPYEQGILVLVRDTETKTLPEYLVGLEHFCENFGLHCGISLVHVGFMQIKEAYTQAIIAYEFGKDDKENRSLLFQEHYVPCLANALSSTVPISCFCHPKVLRLWLRGGEKGRALVETLRHYLIHGRNANATARVMRLHRNTVLYRINRLQELFGQELGSSDADTYLMLVLSCLLVDQVQTHRRISVS